MRIGILTFHMAHNFGAMLQAYALAKTIEKMGVDKCEIIDYRFPQIYKKYAMLLTQENVEPKRLRFHEFMLDKLPLSKEISNIEEAVEYDMIILGSDQIWNPNITGGYRDEYFGKFVSQNTYLISYAASTGIDVEKWGDLASKMERLDKISVRERWCACKLLQHLGKEITVCVDPVFLLDVKEWKNLIKNSAEKKYILIYAFEMYDEEYRQIQEKARNEGCRIVEIVTHNREERTDIDYDINCGPQEFLNYLSGAEYIYTDSYHGVLFSIIFNKKFIVLTKDRSRNLRIQDILDRLSMEKTEEDYYKRDLQADKLLKNEINGSMRFLKNCIDERKRCETEV